LFHETGPDRIVTRFRVLSRVEPVISNRGRRSFSEGRRRKGALRFLRGLFGVSGHGSAHRAKKEISQRKRPACYDGKYRPMRVRPHPRLAPREALPFAPPAALERSPRLRRAGRKPLGKLPLPHRPRGGAKGIPGNSCAENRRPLGALGPGRPYRCPIFRSAPSGVRV